MTISMTVLTDGRKQYLETALPPWVMHYVDQVDYRFIVDDSGNTGYRHWLVETFPDFIVVAVDNERQGYANAMRKVFEVIVASGSDYNLHIEDDFVLKRPFVLRDVVDVLATNPELSQISFMREPWYSNEVEFGGVIEALLAQGTFPLENMGAGRFGWTKHVAYWTCNPSVFPSWVARRPWPDDPWCEMKFAQDLRRDRKPSGLWGHQGDWVYTGHIGVERAGHGY
jgi:hypothetical protein